MLSEWINPMYLDVGVQSQIQLPFEAESQIELPDFLLVGQRSVYQTIVSFMIYCDYTITLLLICYTLTVQI